MNRLFESIEQTPIATIVTDARQADNPIVAVNAAFCALTGYQKEEVLGHNCRFLAGEATEPEAQAMLRDAIAAARPVLVELLNYRKDGTSFRNAVMIAPVLDGEGGVGFFLGSQMDVTGEPRRPTPRQAQSQARAAALTRRQRQVLEHMIAGFRNKQIAAVLGIDEKTVKMHRAGLLTKLGATTSAEAIRIGVEAGVELG